MNKTKNPTVKDYIENINPIDISYDMEKSYIAYSGSVIIGRALPDLRDGLKPVHRRILYAMYEDGNVFNKPYTKSAAVVGDVMKKYHPHGDSSIYDAMVRLAQDFVMAVPLIDSQGNFGSIDGDMPAAMRYTEARMAKISQHLMADIEKNTVEFRDNYNAAYKEPTVLPAAFPNLLVNGSSGIAVGMATNIPPFNLSEVLSACIFCLKNKDANAADILKIIKGPDFPTGGTIIGESSIKNALLSGRGSIVVRGVAEIEQANNNKQNIIISEIPYQVNKARLIEKIIELIKDKTLDGIADIRDESAFAGIRIVIELKRDAIADIVLNRLYKFTPLQESFGLNMMVIHNMRPMLMSVFEIIKAFLEFRKTTVIKRLKFELDKFRSRMHILIGLAAAIGEIDRAIEIIRGAKDVEEARNQLLKEKWQANFITEINAPMEKDLNAIDEEGKCQLSEEQVKAILDLRLHRLTKLEKNKLIDEINLIGHEVHNCLRLLNNDQELINLMIDEFQKIKNDFAIERRTKIIETNLEENIEDLIEHESMVIIVTNNGYIKRVSLDSYRTQARGGKGRGSGQGVNEEDSIAQLLTGDTHDHVLFFFDTGYVYKSKVYKLPQGEPTSRGRSITNIFNVSNESKIKKVIVLPQDTTTWGKYEILFITARGNIRKNSLEDFRNIAANGKIAIRFDEISDAEESNNISLKQDYLVDVCLCESSEHVLIASKNGKAVRFPVSAVRVFKSRTSNGVRAIKLGFDDYVIGASILNNMEFEDILKRDQYLSLDYQSRINFDPQKDCLPSELNLLQAEEINKFAQKEELILTVTENGYGKLTSAYDYRVTNRGGSGVTNILTSIRNGHVIASFCVSLKDSIMLITDRGQIIRINAQNIRISGRNTQGVTLFRMNDGEKVCRVAKVIESSTSETE